MNDEPPRRRKRRALEPDDFPGLDKLRAALLASHRALLAAGRIDYEREHGRIEGQNLFLKIALDDPAFAWIREVSALIVALDQAVDDGDAALLSTAVQRIRALFDPESTNHEFTSRYREAMQRHPDVLLGHGSLVGSLRGVVTPQS